MGGRYRPTAPAARPHNHLTAHRPTHPTAEPPDRPATHPPQTDNGACRTQKNAKERKIYVREDWIAQIDRPNRVSLCICLLNGRAHPTAQPPNRRATQPPNRPPEVDHDGVPGRVERNVRLAQGLHVGGEVPADAEDDRGLGRQPHVLLGGWEVVQVVGAIGCRDATG